MLTTFQFALVQTELRHSRGAFGGFSDDFRLSAPAGLYGLFDGGATSNASGQKYKDGQLYCNFPC